MTSMPKLPSVAVCIPTYNQAQYLIQSVSSACCQTYPNVEVWVSDDGSTDETPQVMEQLCQQFPQVRYYRQPKNLGIAGNNTWLMSQPKTDFIVRLDSDDALMPNYVEKLVSLLQKYPEAGYAHTAIQEIDEHGKNRSIGRVVRKKEFQNSDEALMAAVSGYRVAANIIMFRTKALQELRYYENRPEYVEDYDLSVRIADAGYGNVYADEVLAKYRVWTDVQKTRSKRKHLQLRGYIRIFEESFLPAFQRRGWDVKVLDKQRRKMAIIHSAYCFLPIFNQEERAELVALLKQLGDSPLLRLRIVALSLGFAPFFEWQLHTELKLKGFVKDWLSKLKSISLVKAVG
ncbi:glycosyltransferase [Fischerella thermalis]|uniref:glycosyltransferase n=1 Tax=Fischerella thermalis TaxID=372787 RepID=UPI000C7FEEE5|nr:glycosyltransferase family 2 protein [Fischerella thermalis]PLZ04963.1 glycosyl transferase [Fischerella thermalis WC1110]PLZ16929.1 glycosyl transferase [Fischerella thermalis WC341]PLZ38370.1 glycosyl transferase [Fischerella thermalis WC538]PLZ40166.1 glycosyl transferase [Fischerella thermalis WC527]PLZ62832.1 glycosyl transferase [Fischerella thermalis WC249]